MFSRLELNPLTLRFPDQDLRPCAEWKEAFIHHLATAKRARQLADRRDPAPRIHSLLDFSSSTNMAAPGHLGLLLAVSLIAPVVADSGDDFSNNLFSDLAP